jgi:hypothetical protein
VKSISADLCLEDPALSVVEDVGSFNDLAPPEPAPDMSLRGCLADMREGWEDMSPRSRLAFMGSGIVSAAMYGYVTYKCGPIPSLRKMAAMIPDLMGRENRDWVRHIAGNATAAVGRLATRPNLRVRKTAGVLATVVMAASMCSADTTDRPLPESVLVSVSHEER